MQALFLMESREVLVDTNLLLEPARSKIDVLAKLKVMGYSPVLLSCVMDELAVLAKKKGKTGAEAKVGVMLIAKSSPKIVFAERPTDSAIVKYAKERNASVATNDIGLIKRLKTLRIRIVRLRQRKLLVQE